MSEQKQTQNPYQPTSLYDGASRRGSRGRIALSIYSAATVSFAAFIVLGICFGGEQALFVIPGLDENVTGVGVCAVALVCGGCAALFCSQVLRYELASRIAVFAITNALVAFVLVASFAVLEMTDVGGFRVFPRSSAPIAPAHYALLFFSAIGGIFGPGAVVNEMHDERPLLVVVLGISTLLCLILVAPFLFLLSS